MKSNIFIIAAVTLLAIAVVACGVPPLPAPAALPTRTHATDTASHTQAAANNTSTSANDSGTAALGISVDTAVNRIGIIPLEPAAPTGQPNTVRDPADVPDDIYRRVGRDPARRTVDHGASHE